MNGNISRLLGGSSNRIHRQVITYKGRGGGGVEPDNKVITDQGESTDCYYNRGRVGDISWDGGSVYCNVGVCNGRRGRSSSSRG